MSIRLFAYDIPDDKMRDKLAKKLLAWGFERWQYSVFCGAHTPTQWKNCWAAVQKLLKRYGKGNEKIMVIIIGAQELRNMVTVGDKPDLAELLGEKLTFWI